MVKLEISTFISNGSLWLYLDNNIIVEGGETLTLPLNDDSEFVVHWFVRAPVGSSYSITISSPREANFQLTKGVGNGEKDFGAFVFKNRKKFQ